MEEYIDILNEKGDKDDVRTKNKVHEKVLWHKSVYVWILNSHCELL